MRKANEIEIKEDVKIGDMILEKGDKIKVLESYNSQDAVRAIENNGGVFNLKVDSASVSWDMRSDDLFLDDGHIYTFYLEDGELSYSVQSGHSEDYDEEVTLEDLEDMPDLIARPDWS